MPWSHTPAVILKSQVSRKHAHANGEWKTCVQKLHLKALTRVSVREQLPWISSHTYITVACGRTKQSRVNTCIRVFVPMSCQHISSCAHVLYLSIHTHTHTHTQTHNLVSSASLCVCTCMHACIQVNMYNANAHT